MKTIAIELGYGLFRLIDMSTLLAVSAAVVYPASSVQAQTTPGSIVTHTVATVSNSGPSLVDRTGNLYTATSVMPPVPTTPGAAQPQPGGGTCTIVSPPGAFPGPCYTAYIAKNDPLGNRIFATYLGGASASGASVIAIDSSGNIYVAGTAGSPFPTMTNAAVATIPTNTGTASFAAKLSADGSKFLYVTYLPACMISPTAIAVDPQGSAYIAGSTSATNDPEAGVFQHACIVKLSADGSSVVYTKMLAGSNQDHPTALAADASGNAYLTGSTASPDFPVSDGAAQPNLTGAQNAFLTKLDSSGNIIFSTYLGGSQKDSGNALQVDASSNVYLAGKSTSLDFPTTGGTLDPQPVVPAQSTSPGGFVAKVAPDGNSVIWATYLTSPVALALGEAGDLYVSGGAGPGEIPITSSAPLPCAPGGPQTAGGDYVVHLSTTGSLLDATWVNQDTLTGFGLLGNGSLVLAAVGSVTQLAFGGAGWSSAPCMTLAALNAATLDVTPIVPGELLTFLGSGIGPTDGVAATVGQQGLPVSLGGVQVFFDGTPAPLLYAQSGQVNVQAPMELAGKLSTAITLSYGGNTFGPVTVPVRFAYPGLFRLRVGLTSQAVVENQDGSLNGPSNPATVGSVVTFWGTGFPATSPACPTGGLNPDSPVDLSTMFSVVMTGGGAVQYAGTSPGLACGVTQINMQIPLTASPGTLLITPDVCTNGGNTCIGGPTGATIYVK